MTRTAPGLPLLATPTRLAYARPDTRFRPPDGFRPTLVWQFVHARRPEESVVSKISCWMLENVGSRFGVGPVRLESFSSQPAAVSTNTKAAAPSIARLQPVRMSM